MNVRSWLAAHRSAAPLRLASKVSRRFLRAYGNGHNWDIATNGELFLARVVMSKKPGVILDVGANLGQYALQVSPLMGVTRVHSFEISPPTFAKLAKNCESTQNVTLNDFGLGSQEAFLPIFHAAQAEDRTSIYAVEDGFAREQIMAKVRTGDTYMEEAGLHEVSLLKIDVEGHDLATLQGFKASFESGKIAVVQFEHGAPSIESRTFLRDLMRFLESVGMNCYALFPKHLERMGKWSPEMEDFEGRNYVAMTPAMSMIMSGVISDRANS